jgi:steroid 5-alpha reductase family enzyme
MHLLQFIHFLQPLLALLIYYPRNNNNNSSNKPKFVEIMNSREFFFIVDITFETIAASQLSISLKAP